MNKSKLLGPAVLSLYLAFCCPAGAKQPVISAAVSSDTIQSGEQALKVGDYKSAVSIFTQAVNQAGKGGDTAAALTGLGEAYLGQGMFTQALAPLNKALWLTQKNPGQDAQLGRILDDMSWVYQAGGKMDKASDACRQALFIRQKFPGVDSDDLGDTAEHMGFIFESQKDYTQAAQYYKQAAEARRAKAENSIAMANDLDKLAAMYLKIGKNNESQDLFLQSLHIKDSLGCAVKPFAPHPVMETCVFRWVNGAPNCSRTFSDGKQNLTIQANYLTVQASMDVKATEFVKSTRANITISNNSNMPVDLLPQPAQLVMLSPKVKVLNPLDTEQLAQKVEHSGNLKAGWVKFWGENATTPVTTTVVGANNAGFFPYGNPYWVSGVTPPVISRNGNITSITTNVPDYAAQARALIKADQIHNRSAAEADSMRQAAIGPTTVKPGESVGGALNFEQSNFDHALLVVPVGNAVFQFDFQR